MKQIIFIISFFSLTAYSQLPSYTPTQDLLAWYSYSGNILDNSGNGHNNASYNIISTTDRFNTNMRALYFSGTGSEYLNYGDVDDFEGWIQESFSFWIRPENYGNSNSEQLMPILSKWSTPNDLQGSSYNIVMDGTDLCLILSDGSNTDTIKASLSNIPLNQWSHVVITTNYGFAKIYINNVIVTDIVTTISQIKSSDAEFKVGDWYFDVDSNFTPYIGKIDDLGIWNRELTECEVDALYTGFNCIVNDQELSLESQQPELVKIVDLMGRKTTYQSNKVLIFIYSDGSIEKKFTME